jgi:hypothetical protein
MKAFGVIVVVKLLAIGAMLILFRALQIRFGISVAILASAHVAVAMALVIYALRGRIQRRRQGLPHHDGIARSTL